MAALLLSTPPPVVSPDPLNSSNSSLAPPPPAAAGAVRLGMALLLAAMALGVPGNLFVVWTVLCRLRRRSVTSLLLLHLACADAAVLLTAPFFLRYLAAGLDWEFGDATCRCLHYACCVNMYASVLLIGGMSLDRLLGVSRPFLSQKVRTKSRAGRVALGIWAAALVLSVPMLFYRRAGCEQDGV
nr:PREDICTED: leukotriene B4 receptor 1-like [Lepisosteus oculatus]